MSNRKLAGGMVAVLVLAMAAFAGLYFIVARVSARIQRDRLEEGTPLRAPAAQEDAPTTGGGVASLPPLPASPDAPADSAKGAPSKAASAAAAAAAEGEIDLALDEPTLEKFLEVRRRMFESYGPNRAQFAIMEEDLAEFRLKNKEALQKAAMFLPLMQAQKDGLAATGLSQQEYARIAKVVYDHWWRATAAGVDIEPRAGQLRKELEEVQSKIDAPGARHKVVHRLAAQKSTLERKLGYLEWARSQAGRELLAKIPAATRSVCEKHAAEIDTYAMIEGPEMLTF